MLNDFIGSYFELHEAPWELAEESITYKVLPHGNEMDCMNCAHDDYCRFECEMGRNKQGFSFEPVEVE